MKVSVKSFKESKEITVNEVHFEGEVEYHIDDKVFTRREDVEKYIKDTYGDDYHMYPNIVYRTDSY